LQTAVIDSQRQKTLTNTKSYKSSSFSKIIIIMSLDSFHEILSGLFFGRGRGGGRRPQEANQEPLDPNEETWLQPCKPHEARLTIVQVTDVYTLDNFASLKTMLQEIRKAQGPNDKVISMLTGDFLAPYLLSSIDNGAGMMMAINETPIDYLTWGNHEADIPHKQVCKHVKNYTGTFINTNMQSHESMKYDCSVPYEIIEVASADGQHKHKIGFLGLLSNDPKLYSHFKEPAFGGATIEDPWETLAKYKKILEEEHGCDLVVPLEHMYIPENVKTTEKYKDCGSIPLILSGHDHHRVDQVINNTRLIKPGMDGVHAAVIQIVYDKNKPDAKPNIRSTFVPLNTFEPCPELKAKTDAAYDVLLPLRNTMLAQILPQFFPLTSKNARGSVCTMGKLICSMLKQALLQDYYAAADDSSDEDDNSSGIKHNKVPLMKKKIDAVILMGGNIRGNEDYPDDAFFSLETLEAEIKSDEVVGFTEMPGSVLAAGIEATHAGDPRPGWFQYDDGITQDPVTKKVLTVGGKPINPKRIYRVATKIKDLTNGQR
jgi:2',3'-cyclic-nucleotide 2'-phosphodiesterase (5'-nucleotidase family)